MNATAISTCPTDFIYHHFGNLTKFRNDVGEANETTQIILDIIPYVGLVIGLIIGHAGFRIVKPVCGVIGFVLGTIAVIIGLQIDADFIQDLTCEVEIVATIIAGTAVAILTSCLVRCACFLIGAAGGVAITMLVFHIFPALDAVLWNGAPSFLGHTIIPHWLSVLLVGGISGYVCKRKHREVILVATALIGALGVGLSTRHLFHLHTQLKLRDIEIIFYSAFAFTSLTGLTAQYILYRRQKRRENEGNNTRTRSRSRRRDRDRDTGDIEVIQIRR